jgi:hypothetical protein
MMSGEEEQRPLLGPTHAPHNDAEIVPAVEEREEGAGGVTPLPMRQISILLLLQLAEPITFTVI